MVLFAAVSVAVCASGSFGATLRVERDGSGDFTTIQPALDVAADGDTVLIGPGEYTEETTYRLPDLTYDFRAYGRVVCNNLTIIGAGLDQTVLGPVDFVEDTYHNPRGITYADSGSISISDLTIRNCDWGAVLVEGTLFADRLRLDGNTIGIGWFPLGAGGWIRSVEASGTTETYPLTSSTPLDWAVYVSGPGENIVVEGCVVVDAGMYFRNVTNLDILNCDIDRGRGGVSLVGTSEVLLQNCSILDVASTAVEFSSSGGVCEIRDSTIGSRGSALRIGASSPLIASNSVFIGGSSPVIYAERGSGPCVITECDLVTGNGSVIYCEAGGNPVIHDLRNNYWGTTDPNTIAEWIVDNNDDSEIQATVLYAPFATGALPAEEKSIGSVKSMFR